MKVAALAAVILLILFIVSMLVLWTLNTLFPVLAIPYTFKTVIAGGLLSMMVGSSSVRSK